MVEMNIIKRVKTQLYRKVFTVCVPDQRLNCLKIKKTNKKI